MNRLIINFLNIFLVFVLVGQSGVSYAAYRRVNKNLSYLVKNKAVQVAIGKFDKQDDVQYSKEDFIKFLTEELTRHFSNEIKVVSAESEADIVIQGNIKEYYYSEKDPIDNLVGSAAIVLDVIKQDSYGRMQVEIIVYNSKTKKTLWDHLVVATVTRSSMTAKESYALVGRRLAKQVVTKCFGISKNRHHSEM